MVVICRARFLQNNSITAFIHDVFDIDDIQKMSQSVTDSAFAKSLSQGLRGPALNRHILADFYRKINMYNLYSLKGNKDYVNSMNQMAGERANNKVDESL